jgi:hypothetical protein
MAEKDLGEMTIEELRAAYDQNFKDITAAKADTDLEKVGEEGLAILREVARRSEPNEE